MFSELSVMSNGNPSSFPPLDGDVVLSHLERELGAVAGAWKELVNGESLPFRILRFADQPCSDVSTCATFGLSREPLCQHDGSFLREEFMISASDDTSSDEVAAVLALIGERSLQSGSAIARGDVVRLPAELSLGRSRALFALPPTAFDDSLYMIRSAEPPVAFMWLLPITTREADFAESNGWEALERRLIEVDPDIYDPMRPSVV